MRDLVYRDADGNVVNIGPWQEDRTVEQVKDEDGTPLFDKDGNAQMEIVINNPVPEGLTVSEEEIVVMPDKARYAVNDPRRPGFALT